MPLFIGLDIGTTKLAALALDADSGEVVASVSTPNSARRDTTASRAHPRRAGHGRA